MQAAVCVDDFGTALYACRFTGRLVGGDAAQTCGAIVPGVRAVYVMADTDAARAAKKASEQAFHESEANCNTCQHLERVPHDKSKAGLLYGRCNRHGVSLDFHPADPMNMQCHNLRIKNGSE